MIYGMNCTAEINEYWQEIIASLTAKITSQQEVINEKKYEVERLLIQYKLLAQKLYGSSSEKQKYLEGQYELFNESECIVDEENKAEQQAQNVETIEVHTHQRKKSGRKPLPENLPRVEVVHDLEDNEKL